MDLSQLGALVDSGQIQVKRHPNELRLAGDALTEKVVAEILTPWKNLEKDTSRPNYEGRTQGEWKADNARIKGLILKAEAQGKPIEYAKNILQANGFTDNESNLILGTIRNKVFQTEDYAVPNARADEDVSRAVLNYSGYSPVRMGNDDNAQATDLSMSLPGGKQVMVDAQVRATPRGLNLGIIKYADKDLLSIMEANPNKALNAILTEEVQRRTRMVEDKLLHTSDRNINPIMSGFLRRENNDSVKDFLITSNRPESRRMKQYRGPYNREKASGGWDLVDMNRARGIILPKSLNQLIELTNNEDVLSSNTTKRGTSLSILLPNELVRRELTNRAVSLDPDVVKMFTGPKTGIIPRRR